MKFHLSAGDGPPQDDQIGVQRELANHLGRSVSKRRARQHPLVQLTTKRLDRRALSGLVFAGPGRELRVAGPVQPDQPRHLDLLPLVSPDYTTATPRAQRPRIRCNSARLRLATGTSSPSSSDSTDVPPG